MRRLQMVEHSIIALGQLPPDGSEALALHTVQEVNVALNGLYLNLRGSLDNAAWACVHHFPLVEKPSKDDYDHRGLANLFGRRFRKTLRSHDPELSERLRAHAEWGRELASVRDPAAHRIPLYIPPCVLDEDGVSRVTEIDEKMKLRAEAKDWDGFREAMMNRWKAGPFRRVIILSEQEGLAFGSLDWTLDRDIANTLDILELVVAFVFAEGQREMSAIGGRLPKRRKRRAEY